jgi:O-methyltransferase
MDNLLELWYSELGEKSYLGFNKFTNIVRSLNEVYNLQGDTAEIGVYQGYTSKLIHTVLDNKTHFCYDTFKGIIGSDPSIDRIPDGYFSCNLDTVKNNINMDNVIYVSGYFPDTFQENTKSFCFIHSDTDTYVGTKATLEIFAPLIVNKGKILFDDYKDKNCPGVEKAVHEFLEKNNDFMFESLVNITLDIYQCVLTKINK